MSSRRAVVVGGGLAGLCAAQVLANHFDEVVLIERDDLADDAAPRRGVPQARHLHNLLVRGLRDLESLFPGFVTELEVAGAVPVDMGLELKMLSVFGWFPRHRAEIVLRCCSRSLVEQVVRRRVRALPRINWLTGHEVQGLLLDAHKVRGVRCNPRAGTGSGELQIESLLVVDAGGRGSHLFDGLREAGVVAPEVTEVDAFLGYATRIVRKPAAEPDWRALIVRNPMPSPRGGAILPLEGGRWIVTLVGFGRDYPPTSEAGFDACARSLTPEVHAAVSSAQPDSDITGYRQTANRWRHHERLPHWPPGYAAVGDSVCTFNPLYGQGMTVAVMEAVALRDLLAERGAAPDLGGHLRLRVARLLAVPWRIATSEDYRYPSTAGPPRSSAMKAMHGYADRVIRVALRSPEVHTRWMRVVNLLDDPATLLAPSVVARVLSTWRRETAAEVRSIGA